MRLELAKSGIIGKILISRAHGLSFVVLAKFMPIANVNKIVFVN